MISSEWLSDIPQQFKNKSNISGLIRAISAELDELNEVFKCLVSERNIDSARGAQLDMLGSIIGLTRAEAMSMYSYDFTDDIYRVLLKYKMLLNTNRCTLEELYDACKLLYGAQSIAYHESRASPAAFSLGIGTQLTTETIGLLTSAGVSVKPAGVRANISYHSMDVFGFKDVSEYVLGFGQGKFAQSL
ncbi:MAG: DUF2612 domain-containing protein [Oscillospiraceae bacterium]|nr:DUF2612 domain-containing protein [Oscillospiraceae bacterium]